MKTYTATVVSAQDSTVRVRFASGFELDLRASTRISLAAIMMIGHRVRFAAELSEHTSCLTSPVFCIGSGYGLRAAVDAPAG